MFPSSVVMTTTCVVTQGYVGRHKVTHADTRLHEVTPVVGVTHGDTRLHGETQGDTCRHKAT